MIQAKQIAGITTYLFKPGLPSSGARFGTWDELEAAGSAAGMPVLVEVDDSIAPAVMPGRPAPWIGVLAGSLRDPNLATGVSTLVVQDGATLPNLSALTNNLRFNAQATTTSPITLVDEQLLFLDSGASIFTTGTKPAILATPGNSTINPPTIALLVGGRLGSGNGDVGVFPLPFATNGLNIFLLGAISNVPQGSLVGPGSALIAYTAFSQIGTADTLLPPTQPGLAMLQVLNFSQPFLQTYYAEALALGTTYLPPGSSVLSSTRPAAGFRPIFVGITTLLFITATGPGGNPANSKVQFDLLDNGVPVPGASITLDANTGAPAPPSSSNLVQFLAAYASGDVLSLRTTEIGGPLVNGLQDVVVTLV